MLKRYLTLTAVCLGFVCTAEQANAQDLHIYNWSDYIATDTIANFEQETGIKVTYDVYDSNEVLETKLFAGHSGFDIVFPTARPFAGRHVKTGIYQTLNKSLLPNLINIDPIILNSLNDLDQQNAHLVPYMWGTTGIGINVKKVKEILGESIELASWQLLLDPTITAKLSACGITLMDDVTEVFAGVKAYKGLPATDFSKAAIDQFSTVLKSIRPHVKYFHSSQYINDLANGDICVAHGYSGDILQARDRAKEANNGVEIAYLVPSEGAVVWTDVMAIPADAKNIEQAHKFINYLMKPEVIAEVTNFVSYANANIKSTQYINEDIAKDQGIYPPEKTQEKLVVLTTPSDKQTRDMNRVWTRLKTNL